MTSETGPVAAAEAVLRDHEWSHTSRSCRCLWYPSLGLSRSEQLRQHRAHVAATLAAAAGLLADPAATDTSAEQALAAVEALCRRPSGKREWHNQGRSGWADVVDVSAIRAIVRAVRDTTEPEEQRP